MISKSEDNSRDFWRYLFTPESIALIGASNTPGSWGHGIMHHLLASPAKVYPVNPKATDILGVHAYNSLPSIPGPVDLAIIAVAAPQVPAVMLQCVAKAVKAALVISGGFAEVGAEGSKLESQVLATARSSGIRFVGPNSMGHLNSYARLSTLAWTKEVVPGGAALLSQSGNFGHRIIHSGMRAGFGFSKAVSTGNEADLHLEDYLEFLGDDGESRVIACYIEGLREARRFFELAKKITPRKPIVVIKSGGTQGSARAAATHTGALAGSDAIYTAAFRQAGVIRVEDDDELCDVVGALLTQPLPRDDRVGILTVGGGLGVVAAEAIEREGLKVASLSPGTIDKLDAQLPARWSRSNPVDTAGIPFAGIEKVYPLLWAMIEDENIDAILFQAPVGLGIRRLSRTFPEREVNAWQESEENNLSLIRQRVAGYGKPVLLVAPSVEFAADPEAAAILHREGIPIYQNPRQAARVLKHLSWYRRYLDRVNE
jgi:acyl-CoA synthetase (NDP forming)